jgi:hypothetical protein
MACCELRNGRDIGGGDGCMDEHRLKFLKNCGKSSERRFISPLVDGYFRAIRYTRKVIAEVKIPNGTTGCPVRWCGGRRARFDYPARIVDRNCCNPQTHDG